MIDLSKFAEKKEFENDGQKVSYYNIGDFPCEFCDQTFPESTFLQTVFLYGIFMLGGEKACFVGINCPKCLKTLLLSVEKHIFSYIFETIREKTYFTFYRYNESFTEKVAQKSMPMKLSYESTGHLGTEEFKEVQNLGVQVDNMITTSDWYWDTSELEDDLVSSYYFTPPEPIGSCLSIWNFPIDSIPKIVEIENNTNKRIIPRYVHNISIYELISNFSWNYFLQIRYVELIKESSEIARQKIYQTDAYKVVKDDEEKRKEFLKETFGFNVSPQFLSEHLEQVKSGMERIKATIPADFHEILTHRLSPLELPSQDHPIARTFWGRQHPFKDIGMPDLSVETLPDELDIPEQDGNTDKTIADLVNYFIRGYGLQFFHQNYKAFIDEYIKLLRSSCCSYAAIAELVSKYREKAYIEMKAEFMEDKQYAFYKAGPAWNIKFDGRPLKAMRGKGFQYIHFLVERKRQQFHTDKIEAFFDGRQSTAQPEAKHKKFYDDDLTTGSGGNLSRQEIIDERGLKARQDRLKELGEERIVAENNNDFLRLEKIDWEVEEIKKDLKKSVGPGGKFRFYRDASMTKKDKITKSISRALKEIKKHDPEAYRHFYEALQPINDFQQCYNPQDDIEWHLG